MMFRQFCQQFVEPDRVDFSGSAAGFGKAQQGRLFKNVPFKQ